MGTLVRPHCAEPNGEVVGTQPNGPWNGHDTAMGHGTMRPSVLWLPPGASQNVGLPMIAQFAFRKPHVARFLETKIDESGPCGKTARLLWTYRF